MIETQKMIADLKSGALQGITVLQMLAEEGVRFICASGTGGSGKDLQLDLLEATLVHNDKLIVHVSTSAAIRHYQKGTDTLGKSLRAAAENEKRGILFPDEPTLSALACDVLEFYSKGFREVLFSGFPRGTRQPELALSIKEATIQHYNIGLRTAIERAIMRTRQRIKLGFPKREDDHLPTVRSRFHDHMEKTVPELRRLDRLHPFRIKWINGDQPIAAVLHDSLEALGCDARLVDDCLGTFERREGGVARIMAEIEGQQVIPECRRKKAPLPQGRKGPSLTVVVSSPSTFSLPTGGKWQTFWANKARVQATA